MRALQVFQLRQAARHALMHIVRDDNHFLEHLRLEIEARKGGLQLFIELLQVRKNSRLAPAGGMQPSGIFFVHLVVQMLHFADQHSQILEVAFAALDFAVHHHAIETFLRRIGQQFVGDGQMFFRGKSKPVKDFLHRQFGFLDPFADCNFLFAREQRHLRHLAHIHAYGIVQVLTAIFFDLLCLSTARRLGVALVDYLDIEAAEPRINLVDVIGRNMVIAQRVIDVVGRQVTALVREIDQSLDFFGEVNAGARLERFDHGFFAGRCRRGRHLPWDSNKFRASLRFFWALFGMFGAVAISIAIV